MAPMHDRPSGRRSAEDRALERAIVLRVLYTADGRKCSRTRLAAELDADSGRLVPALARLRDAGVVCADEVDVWASRAARHIDELGLLGI